MLDPRLQEVLVKYRYASQRVQKMHSDAKRRYKIWRMLRKEGKEDFEHSITQPLSFIDASMIRARLIQSLFAATTFFDSLPRSADDVGMT